MTLFIILSLATWRLSHLITNEDGPYQMLAEFRHITVRYTKLFSCIYCLSVWLGIIFVIGYYFYPTIVFWIALPMALSGLAIVIDRWVNG